MIILELCPQVANIMTHALALLTLTRPDFTRSLCAHTSEGPALWRASPVSHSGNVGHLNRFLHNPPILTKGLAQKVHLASDNYVIKS